MIKKAICVFLEVKFVLFSLLLGPFSSLNFIFLCTVNIFIFFISFRLNRYIYICYFFFFQAEDGIRDRTVTGVQTCALPICSLSRSRPKRAAPGGADVRLM